MKFEWENLLAWGSRSICHGGRSVRAKVPGGWIVNNYTWVENQGICESSVFVPDPEHEWEID